MLIVYDNITKDIISISGTRFEEITDNEINLINEMELVEPKEYEREYRIYDAKSIDDILTAVENGDVITLTLNDNNEPNGVLIEPGEPQIIDELLDDEKIAMAEAIIDLNMRIEELENRLNGGV